MSGYDAEVAVIGGGIVGCAVAEALAVRGVATILIEAGASLGGAASGSNSGILHTGFDSVPGELETELILRSGPLREQLAPALGVIVRRCGARLRGHDDAQHAAIARLAANAARNGVEVDLRGPGELIVPGQSIPDPLAFTAAPGERAPGELLWTGARRFSPPLEGREPIAAYAGLRPAGRGVNYAIAPSRTLPGLVNAAAIRSTGLTAAPAIGEYVAGLLAAATGLRLAEPAKLAPLPGRAPEEPWWRVAAERSRRSARGAA